MNRTAENNADFFNLVSRYRTPIMGFAAIWIFAFHNRFFFPLTMQPAYILTCVFLKNIGFCGVDIFLFLTGIGLFASISRNSIKQYYINRLRRIGFIYIISSAIPAIVLGWSALKYVRVISLWESFSVNLYCALWFYTLIIPIYLLFPAYYYLFNKASNKLLFSILLLILWVGVGIALKPVMRADLWGLYNRLPITIIGIYAGYWSSSHTFKITPLSICLLISSLALGIYLEVLTTLMMKELIIPVSNSHFPSAILAVSLCFILARLFCLISNIKILKYIPKVFSIWGSMSLEFYSLQEILMHVTNDFFIENIPPYLRSLLTFVLVSLAAYGLHYLNKLVFILLDKYVLHRTKPDNMPIN